MKKHLVALSVLTWIWITYTNDRSWGWWSSAGWSARRSCWRWRILEKQNKTYKKHHAFLTYWSLGNVTVILSVWFSQFLHSSCLGIILKVTSGIYHRTSLMRNQHLFEQWRGAYSQQIITWAKEDQDLCRYMVPLGHDELIYWAWRLSTFAGPTSLAPFEFI